jgi:hypothetical protein
MRGDPRVPEPDPEISWVVDLALGRAAGKIAQWMAGCGAQVANVSWRRSGTFLRLANSPRTRTFKLSSDPKLPQSSTTLAALH